MWLVVMLIVLSWKGRRNFLIWLVYMQQIWVCFYILILIYIDIDIDIDIELILILILSWFDNIIRTTVVYIKKKKFFFSFFRGEKFIYVDQLRFLANINLAKKFWKSCLGLLFNCCTINHINQNWAFLFCVSFRGWLFDYQMSISIMIYTNRLRFSAKIN